MSSVNQWIVRDYFEMLGYLVSQPCKYVVPGRQKKPEEEVDLLIINPRVKECRIPDHVVWTSSDLKHVSRAIVGVRGWHTERFYVGTFEQSPDILRFVEREPMRFAASILGSGPMAKILCLPRLPASEALREQSLAVLRERGIDGVISFRTILVELALQIDKNCNYEKSDVLQVMRLLKNYDLLNMSQLELFAKPARRRRKRTASADKPVASPSAPSSANKAPPS